ncbi:GSCFA domain-containing protein [Arenibacter algicola]|uniref:Tetratricopeptide repeat protein n=1 Tax=Arenibacter algicola TaxID=616991 RepID=A0A221URV0_9FLAO|nr:hypothetical protein [Arenibacter algicola]ASO04119.1 tetratricopeptide repeat protein [Arenibacter algicola]
MEKETVSKSTNKGNLIFNKIIAISLPFILVLLLELLLNYFDYGTDYDLFIEDSKNSNYWVMNPHVSEKYFSSKDLSIVGNSEPFPKHKKPNTLRLFILGESTTIGYPYFHNGSFHRWLQYRLMHTFPDVNFEIINLSLTAVNSYTVMGFSKEIINFSPDAILIYTGHNEYYGAMGVGSTNYIGSNTIAIKAVIYLKNYRIIQLLNNIFAKFRNNSSVQKTDPSASRMEVMAAEQEISYGSDIYNKGIQQFRANMNHIFYLFHNSNIPVFVSNLISNEKDLKPFIDNREDQPTEAMSNFTKGKEAYAKENYKEAKSKFVLAKEMDMLRFRAPEAMNSIITELSSEYPNVTLVDTKEIFEINSPHSIIGNETLLEHVHPNLFGYGLMSEAFYNTLKQEKLISPDLNNELSFHQMLNRMPITEVDSLKGAYEIMMLKEGWPFYEPITYNKKNRTFEERLAGALSVNQISWTEAMNQLYSYYLNNNRLHDALKVTEALLLDDLGNADFYIQAGKLSMALEDNKNSSFYFKKGFELSPSFDLSKNLFIIYLNEDKPKKALPYIIYAINNNSSQVNFLPLKKLTEELITLKSDYEINNKDIDIINKIAFKYFSMGNMESATKYIKKALEMDDKNTDALLLLKKINQG